MKTIELKNGEKIELNQAFNMDCLEFMRLLPDKCIDLVLTDPPYGIGEDGGKFRDRKGGGHRVLDKKRWDKETPTKEIFQEIIRVSNHQIIWGGNYFTDKLPVSRCWLYWSKLMGGDFSDGELAWTSFDKVLKEYRQCNKMGGKIHPTQKPLKLFKWCLEKYAPENAIVFDPFLGSFTTAVACHNYGLQWLGCEKDEDYFKSGYHRYEQETKQLLMEF